MRRERTGSSSGIVSACRRIFHGGLRTVIGGDYLTPEPNDAEHAGRAGRAQVSEAHSRERCRVGRRCGPRWGLAAIAVSAVGKAVAGATLPVPTRSKMTSAAAAPRSIRSARRMSCASIWTDGKGSLIKLPDSMYKHLQLVLRAQRPSMPSQRPRQRPHRHLRTSPLPLSRLSRSSQASSRTAFPRAPRRLSGRGTGSGRTTRRCRATHKACITSRRGHPHRGRVLGQEGGTARTLLTRGRGTPGGR